MNDLTWLDDKNFSVDGVGFRRTALGGMSDTVPDRFTILKPQDTIEYHAQLLADLAPQRIVELGIYMGGSAALAALIAKPEKLVTVDIAEQRIQLLDELIASRQLNVEAHYGVDQGNRAQLGGILDAAFGDAMIDLVLDDASHRPDLTRVSFEVLFPRLRPGGLFVIEDWRWPPLSMLILEQILAFVGVSDITVTRHSTILRRSDAPLGPDFALRANLQPMFHGVFSESDKFTPEQNEAFRKSMFKTKN